MNLFSEKLKELRGKESLRSASTRAKISHNYLRVLELGIDPQTKAPIKPTPEIVKKLAKAYDFPYLELAEMAGIITQEDKLKAIDTKDYIDVIGFGELLSSEVGKVSDPEFLNDMKNKYSHILSENFVFTRDSIRELCRELNKTATSDEVVDFIKLYEEILFNAPKKKSGFIYGERDLYHVIEDPLLHYKGVHMTDKEREEIKGFIEYLRFRNPHENN